MKFIWKNISVIAIVLSVFTVIYSMVSLNRLSDNENRSSNEADIGSAAHLDATSTDIESFNDIIFEMDSEIIIQNAKLKAMDAKLKEMIDVNEDLAKNIAELEEKLFMYEALNMKENLQAHWDLTWKSLDGYGGDLTEAHIEHINNLLQTQFRYNSSVEINPISCFFTSYYDDVKDLNFDNFMRHFPMVEIPLGLPEFDLLRSDEKWYFGSEIEFGFMPVPIHRYRRVDVQEVLETYAGIKVEDLIGDNELVYLGSTDSYYNFTSDYGPGQFKCTGGYVNNGVIKLYRDIEGDKRIVLTLVSESGKYIIKSFNVE